jgi:Ca2+-binding EF-hand superfamily protein
MDKGVGFLSLKDILSKMPSLFGISLKREEFLKLFKEIDSDKDGLIKYKEFEEFYNKDYDAIIKNIERDKERFNIQLEIFDHLMKVL